MASASGQFLDQRLGKVQVWIARGDERNERFAARRSQIREHLIDRRHAVSFLPKIQMVPTS
jgi:hypothetical protein